MKFAGSKQAKIQCCECLELSEPFRVWLWREDKNDDAGVFFWKDGDLPKDWEMEDEVELYDDIVYGYCPKHSHS